jgi:hypothetical protein
VSVTMGKQKFTHKKFGYINPAHLAGHKVTT